MNVALGSITKRHVSKRRTIYLFLFLLEKFCFLNKKKSLCAYIIIHITHHMALSYMNAIDFLSVVFGWCIRWPVFSKHGFRRFQTDTQEAEWKAEGICRAGWSRLKAFARWHLPNARLHVPHFNVPLAFSIIDFCLQLTYQHVLCYGL